MSLFVLVVCFLIVLGVSAEESNFMKYHRGKLLNRIYGIDNPLTFESHGVVGVIWHYVDGKADMILTLHEDPLFGWVAYDQVASPDLLKTAVKDVKVTIHQQPANRFESDGPSFVHLSERATVRLSDGTNALVFDLEEAGMFGQNVLLSSRITYEVEKRIDLELKELREKLSKLLGSAQSAFQDIL